MCDTLIHGDHGENNRLVDEKPTVESLTVVQVAKRILHRAMLINVNPHLKIIDGVTITEDERVKARLFHIDSTQQVATSPTNSIYHK